MAYGEQEWKTRVRQTAIRAVYDRDAVHKILDAGFAGVVALVDDGRPYAVPMAYWRHGDAVYLHAQRKSRIARVLRETPAISLTVLFVDGLVMARNAFSHSMNYRSVMVGGKPEEVTERGEKMSALRALIEYFAEGRWDACRQPDDEEFKATAVFRLSLDGAVAKVRTGPPKEDRKSAEKFPCWAGTLDARTVWGEPEPSDDNARAHPVPNFRV